MSAGHRRIEGRFPSAAHPVPIWPRPPSGADPGTRSQMRQPRTVQVSLVGGTSRSRLGPPGSVPTGLTRVGTGRSLLRAVRTKKAAAGSCARPRGGLSLEDPGDHRLSRQSTIMGPAGLTAVFGMGTGVTPPVWSPRIPAAGDQARRRHLLRWPVTTNRLSRSRTPLAGIVGTPHDPVRIGELCGGHRPIASPLLRGGPIGVVKLLGC